MVGDRDAVGVMAKVAVDLFGTRERSLGVDNPFLWKFTQEVSPRFLRREMRGAADEDELAGVVGDIQRIGDREDDVPVRDWKKGGASRLEPLRLLEALTLRTVPVAARVVRVSISAAADAEVDVPSEGSGATLLDVSHDRELGRGGQMA